jgi:hypothetical protein
MYLKIFPSSRSAGAINTASRLSAGVLVQVTSRWRRRICTVTHQPFLFWLHCFIMCLSTAMIVQLHHFLAERSLTMTLILQMAFVLKHRSRVTIF